MMETIAFTIYRKFANAPHVGRKAKALLWLALGELDDVYQDEILAAADERQRFQARIAELLDDKGGEQ